MVGASRLRGQLCRWLAVIDPWIEIVLTEHSKVQTQGRNIRHYTNYLSERARGYRETKCDFVQERHENRLEKMTVEKGLLRETETLQHQVTALLKCDVGQAREGRGYLLRRSGPGQRTRKRDHDYCFPNARDGFIGTISSFEQGYDQYPRYDALHFESCFDSNLLQVTSLRCHDQTQNERWRYTKTSPSRRIS